MNAELRVWMASRSAVPSCRNLRQFKGWESLRNLRSTNAGVPRKAAQRAGVVCDTLSLSESIVTRRRQVLLAGGHFARRAVLRFCYVFPTVEAYHIVIPGASSAAALALGSSNRTALAREAVVSVDALGSFQRSGQRAAFLVSWLETASVVE
jgi:hypothetical protein